MFDHDKSGTIDIQEFQQLYNYINQWIATFRTYDRDNSGHIEESELSQGNLESTNYVSKYAFALVILPLYNQGVQYPAWNILIT